MSAGCVCKNLYPIANQIAVEKFEYLCCSSNEFLKKFTVLKKLRVKSEKISNDGLSQLTNLESLSISSFIDFDDTVSRMTNLTELYMDVRYESNVSFTVITKLKHLTGLAMKKLPNEGYSMSVLTNLRSLKLDQLAVLPPFFTNLTSLKIGTDTPTSVKFAEIWNYTNLTAIKLLSAPFEPPEAWVSTLTNLTSLKIPSLCTDDTPTSNLKKLNYNYNPVRLTEVPDLLKLNCGRYQLLSHQISTLKRLTCLKNFYSRMTTENDLPVSLRKLTISNVISDMSKLTNLTFLHIRVHFPIPGLSSLTNLTTLKLENNYTIQPEHLKGLTNLTKLRFMPRQFPDNCVRCLSKLRKLERKSGPETTAGVLSDVEEVIYY